MSTLPEAVRARLDRLADVYGIWRDIARALDVHVNSIYKFRARETNSKRLAREIQAYLDDQYPQRAHVAEDQAPYGESPLVRFAGRLRNLAAILEDPQYPQHLKKAEVEAFLRQIAGNVEAYLQLVKHLKE